MSICGTWNQESTENFDEYLKELGIGFVLRKIGNSIKQTLVIENEDKVWKIKLLSSFKNYEFRYEEGVEIHQKTPDGRDCKTTLTMDGSKMITIQNDAKTGKLQTSGTKEIIDGKLIETLKAGNVVAIRTYAKEV